MTDSKTILQENISDEKWPRLTEEINRTQIDFSRGYNIDIEKLNFYDASTLRAVAANLGFDSTDIKTVKENIKEIPEDLAFYMYKYSKVNSGFVILTQLYSEDGNVYFYCFSAGNLLLEIRDNKGNLTERAVYRGELTVFTETYTLSYRLGLKNTHDENGQYMGPQYESSGEGGIITYYLHGRRVSKQEWLAYVEESERLVREIPSMVSGVDALISSYTAF